MSRYCVLSIPRTGSTWLTEGIYGSLLSNNLNKNVINLGEFFTSPSSLGGLSMRTNYFIDNGMIKRRLQPTPNPEKLLEDFISERLSTLLDGDNTQPVILKYMYWSRLNEKINDLDNLTKIKNHNFTIVNINRDPFESTISFLVGKKTNFWIKSTLWSNKNIKPVTKSSITLSLEEVKSNYEIFSSMAKEKQSIADALNCTTVNYESLVEDCAANQIPFKEDNTCKKVYSIEYDEIITNYNELLEIKNE